MTPNNETISASFVICVPSRHFLLFQIWDTRTADCMLTLNGHNGPVMSLQHDQFKVNHLMNRVLGGLSGLAWSGLL